MKLNANQLGFILDVIDEYEGYRDFTTTDGKYSLTENEVDELSSMIADELLAKVKELRPPEQKKETTITKEQLDKLWNALEYTRATISPSGNFKSKENPGWVEIHGGRAFQSESFLNSAIDLVNQLKKELQ